MAIIGFTEPINDLVTAVQWGSKGQKPDWKVSEKAEVRMGKGIANSLENAPNFQPPEFLLLTFYFPWKDTLSPSVFQKYPIDSIFYLALHFKQLFPNHSKAKGF